MLTAEQHAGIIKYTFESTHHRLQEREEYVEARQEATRRQTSEVQERAREVQQLEMRPMQTVAIGEHGASMVQTRVVKQLTSKMEEYKTALEQQVEDCEKQRDEAKRFENECMMGAAALTGYEKAASEAISLSEMHFEMRLAEEKKKTDDDSSHYRSFGTDVDAEDPGLSVSRAQSQAPGGHGIDQEALTTRLRGIMYNAGGDAPPSMQFLSIMAKVPERAPSITSVTFLELSLLSLRGL